MIRSGPVTVHMGGWRSRSSRVWVELRTDSSTWYNSSASLYKPIGSCRLSGVKEVLPIDESNPKTFTISLIDGRTRTFELDTNESCIAWHADMEAAVFTFRNQADKLRMALPLQCITKTAIAPYMTLAERVSVEFETDPDNGPVQDESGEVQSHATHTVEFGSVGARLVADCNRRGTLTGLSSQLPQEPRHLLRPASRRG